MSRNVAKELKIVDRDLRAEHRKDRGSASLKDLKDYSGPFERDLRLTDFSKEQLVDAYCMTCDYIRYIWFAWMAFVEEKCGKQVAIDAHTWLWDKPEVLDAPVSDMKRKCFNIKGTDIESVMKEIQIEPTSLPPLFEKTFEMVSKDCGVINYNKCYMVDKYEDTDPVALKQICENMCPPSIIRTVERINPDIEVTYLSIPPRKSKDDICCKVMFTYKSRKSK